jgi:hypothetical protein
MTARRHPVMTLAEAKVAAASAPTWWLALNLAELCRGSHLHKTSADTSMTPRTKKD